MECDEPSVSPNAAQVRREDYEHVSLTRRTCAARGRNRVPGGRAERRLENSRIEFEGGSREAEPA